MAYRKIFCPECGSQTQVDDSREFCFCLECGNKIILKKRPEPAPAPPAAPLAPPSAPLAPPSAPFAPPSAPLASAPAPAPGDGARQEPQRAELEKKLEEAEFYLQMSAEKKESARLPEEPTYYLKAQDLLVELSSKYPQDHRVWWMLCKPVDFADPENSADIEGQYKINDIQFNKALDLAEISVKRQLIAEYDGYAAAKQRSFEARKAKELERRKEQERERAEALERQRQDEEEQRRREEEEQERLRQEQERLRQEAQEKERQASADADQLMQATANLLGPLVNRDYTAIDGTFFEIQAEGQRYLCTFRNNYNVLCLSAYRIDPQRNAIYVEQSLTVRVSPAGGITRYDNTPVRLRGIDPARSMMTIYGDGRNIYVSGFPLVRNIPYVNDITKTAKKPLLVTKKLLM